MSIWFRSYSLEEVNSICKNTLVEHLGIKIIKMTNNAIEGSMPVDFRTKQPAGLLHGGASVVLAESLASLASNLIVDRSSSTAVGLEINANHIKAVESGEVIGLATPVHLGGSTHIWDIRITTPDAKLVCISRMTIAILKKKD